jgi:hypothetical protein
MEAVKSARLNIGVTEQGGENRGKAVEAYLASCIPSLPPGSPWCVAVVRFRLKAAATLFQRSYDVTMPRTGYTPDYVAWAYRVGKWISVSQAKADPSLLREGDLVCFHFPQMGRHAHMGVIDKIGDWGVHTIEGNTSPELDDSEFVDRDGDGYYPKVRNWSELGPKGGFIALDF